MWLNFTERLSGMTLRIDPSAANLDHDTCADIEKCLSEVSDGWREHLRRSTFHRSVTFTSSGLELGAATPLGKRVQGNEERILTLLRVRIRRGGSGQRYR